MRKILVLLTLLAFVAPASFGLAKTQTGRKTPKTIKCCLDGKCVDSTKESCELQKGMVVINCDDCKPLIPKPK